MAEKNQKQPDIFKSFREAGLSDQQIKKTVSLASKEVQKARPIRPGESLKRYRARIQPTLDATTVGFLERVAQVVSARQPTPQPGGRLREVAEFIGVPGLPGGTPTPVPTVGPSPTPGIPPAPGVAVPPAPLGLAVSPGVGGPPAGLPFALPPTVPGVAPGVAPITELTPDQAGPPLPTTEFPTPPGVSPIAAPAGLPPLPGGALPLPPAAVPPTAGLPPLPSLAAPPLPTATPSAISLGQRLVPDATPQEMQDISDALTEIEAGDMDLFALEAEAPTQV